MVYRLLDIASLAIFAFGGLTFSSLTLFYWRERWSRKHTQHTALPAFTLVAAVAFLSNLLSQGTFPWTPARGCLSRFRC